MVQNPGTPSSSGHIRPLNLPVPVEVDEDRRRHPRSVTLSRRRLEVTSIAEMWQIDNEWWRPAPVSRLYYRVITRGGGSVTIFRDLVGGGWYRHNA